MVFQGLTLLIIMLTCSVPIWSQSDRQLMDILLQNYSTSFRPVHDINTAIQVDVFPIIYAIIRLEEQRESLTLMIWQGIRWTDEFLAWENRDIDWFPDQIIYVPLGLIWVPDVVVFNSLEKVDIIDPSKILAIVHKNGTVYANFPLLLTSRCTFDISEFPFDTQHCKLTYGSWSLQKKQIYVNTDMAPVVTELSTLVLNNNTEWDVTMISIKEREERYADESASRVSGAVFSELDFILTLKRKPAYYIYVLILPTFAIAQINTIGMFTPTNSRSEREEKVTLGLTTLLTMAIFLSIVTDQIPRSQLGLPLLGNYVLFEILISSIGIIVTVVHMFVHEKALLYKIPPPQCLMHCLHGKKAEQNFHSQKVSDASAATCKVSSENNNDITEAFSAWLERRAKSEKTERTIDFEEEWAKIVGVCDIVMMIILFIANIIGTWLIFM
uniref:Uncharacterized protein n=1 Tax=Plectus sambesii TaxID=2011161 RepID=A0A914WHS8_9BILA